MGDEVRSCSLELQQGQLQGGARVVDGVMGARLDLALQELLSQPLQGRPVWRALQDMRLASGRAHAM